MATREWRQANRESVLAYQREYQRDWYRRNAAEVRSRVSERKKAIRDWFRSYKSSLACLRCGETHVACLEFHHRDPSAKDFNGD